MSPELSESDLNRRLTWLLVFRAVVATCLLLLSLAYDLAGIPVAQTSVLLYAVVIGTYLVVFVLGTLLRSGTSPIVLSAVHIAAALMATLMVVHGTGGIDSEFSFMYLLVILDGAIVGSRPAALAVASAASVLYGYQLVSQLHGLSPFARPHSASEADFIKAVVMHGIAFYGIALLAGYLSELLRHEKQVSSQHEAGLRELAQQHGAILESLTIGVVTTNLEGKVASANESALRILRTTRRELSKHGLPHSVTTALVSQSSFEGPLQLGAHTRRLFLERLPLRTRGQSKQRLHGHVLVVEDRTEITALQESLSAKQRLASIGQFAAAIAHEIRNPLAAISGSVELLAMQRSNQEAQAKLQTIILREIKRLNNLINDFLVYARPRDPEFVSVDLKNLATELCEVLKQDHSLPGNPVHLICSETVQARVDAAQIRQLLWNLLRNALDASQQDVPIELELVKEPKAVILEVRDQGEGIPEDMRDHMFEPFRTSKANGTGLGLSVAHRVVEAHGGGIYVDSEMGRGTRIRVELPNR